MMPKAAKSVANVYPTRAASKCRRFREPRTINAARTAVATTPDAPALTCSRVTIVRASFNFDHNAPVRAAAPPRVERGLLRILDMLERRIRTTVLAGFARLEFYRALAARHLVAQEG